MTTIYALFYCVGAVCLPPMSNYATAMQCDRARAEYAAQNPKARWQCAELEVAPWAKIWPPVLSPEDERR